MKSSTGFILFGSALAAYYIMTRAKKTNVINTALASNAKGMGWTFSFNNSVPTSNLAQDPNGLVSRVNYYAANPNVSPTDLLGWTLIGGN